MRLIGTTFPSFDPAADSGAARAIAAGRSRRCQRASVANSGVDVPSAISGSSDGNPPSGMARPRRTRRLRAAASRHARELSTACAGAALASAASPARILVADISCSCVITGPCTLRTGVLSANTSARGRIRIGDIRHHDVERRLGQRVVHHLAEGVEEVAVVRRAMLAARAQRGLDLRQHAAIGEEAVERDVELVDLGREVGEHALHERTPHARIGIGRARRRADRIEDVRHRERIVGLVVGLLAEQRLHAQVERRDLAVREAVEEAGGVLQRLLPVMVEGREHAQRGERCIGIRAASLALDAFHHAPLEEIAQRAVELVEPLGKLLAERFDLAVGNEAVGLEEVVHLAHRGTDELHEPQPELGEARAQQRAPLLERRRGER